MTRSRQWSRPDAAKSALRALRDHGPGVLVERWSPRLGVRRLWLMERHVGTGHATPALPANTELREATADDLDALAALRFAASALEPCDDASRQALRERLGAQLARGDRAWLACSGGQVVAMNWVARGAVPIGYLRRELLLGDGEAYFYDTFVARAQRGRRLGPALYAQMAIRLGQEGVGRIVTLVGGANHRGLHAMARAGFVARGTLTHVPLPGMPLWLGRPGVAHRPLR